jgi:hypothetical protein
MYQQQLDLQFPLTQQLGLNLDVPENVLRELSTPYTGFALDAVWASGTVNSYITVNNSDGDEAARIDDTGISLRMENKSWLKTKVANWLGVKYL